MMKNFRADESGLPVWIVPAGDADCRLRVHAVPRSSRSCICGLQGDSVKIKVKAPPADGKANAELCRFIAELLGLSARSVKLSSGCTGREKSFDISGISARAAAERLLQELNV